MPRLRELLVVEDDADLAAILRAAMQDQADSVRVVGTLAAGREALHSGTVDGILLDVCLPDGQADQFLEHLRDVEPFPLVVAISGAARPEETFRLAQAGVRAFVPKPLDLTTLRRVWSEALSTGPELRPHLRGSVGRRPLLEVEDEVREAMVSEALARASGSRRGAARLLHISRQLLQHIVRRSQGG